MASVETTKDKIIRVSWNLFYKKGYDNTTIEEIITELGISKGGFYHHFRAKSDLLKSISYLFDKQYKKAMKEINKLENKMNEYDKLIYTTEYLYRYIDANVPVDILSLVFSTQVVEKSDKYLLDSNRLYYKFLYDTIESGQKKGQILDNHSVRELVNLYSMQEHAVLYHWCMNDGKFSIATRGVEMVKLFCEWFRK